MSAVTQASTPEAQALSQPIYVLRGRGVFEHVVTGQVGVPHLFAALPSLAQYPPHLSPNAEAVVVALLLCGSYSLYHPVQGTMNAMLLDEVFSDGMRIVAHGGFP